MVLANPAFSILWRFLSFGKKFQTIIEILEFNSRFFFLEDGRVIGLEF